MMRVIPDPFLAMQRGWVLGTQTTRCILTKKSIGSTHIALLHHFYPHYLTFEQSLPHSIIRNFRRKDSLLISESAGLAIYLLN